MALSLWNADPFFGQIERVLDRAFDRAFDRSAGALTTGALPVADIFRSVAGTHPMDVVEYKDHYDVIADAPDFSPEDIHVEVQNNALVIRGEKQIQREEKDEQGKVWRSERSVRRFTRTFTLPQNAKEEGIQAVLDKGVLKVIVPKAPEPEKPQPKRIDVKPASS